MGDNELGRQRNGGGMAASDEEDLAFGKWKPLKDFPWKDDNQLFYKMRDLTRNNINIGHTYK
ncbi:hypothetical protein CDL15_Pgr023599 [Punica granatum]|uniref:Uncharacterized protein n=1 Tax=Punica granatum TaxID=22663 RepID=A0A218W6Z8_PUNGR|nr:hypothetical protein CDL15_Pgr023599 [Punica granatum]